MFLFADSFDLYAAIGDALLGYWDSGNVTNTALSPGRFAGGQSFRNGASSGAFLTKASGANDAVHHIICAFQTAIPLSGTTLFTYLQLLDGTTNQCCIVFRSDGAILLTSGGPAGTVLATYAGAVSAINTWFAFEFEVVINNTTGSFTVRKNGNTLNDFSLGSLNTRGGTTNNYCNKLTVGCQASPPNNLYLDDLLWRSDPSSVPFVGDVRAYVRMPASDVSVTWTRLGGATNTSQVSEAHQDGATSYVFDSNVNDADFYAIASLAASPASTVRAVTRGFLQKSDAGTRGAAVQLKSGGTTVQSTPTLLATTFGWLYRVDLTDPATGAAWTNTGVNNVNIGPVVTS